MKIIQMLRGTFAKKPELADGQMYLAKDTKQVFIGDKAITEGEIELANKSDLDVVKDGVSDNANTIGKLKDDLGSLTTEVNNQASDIADIQADYAQTTGGNTVTANGVVISDENGKLKSVTGSNGQIVKIDANGKPSVGDAGYLPLSGGTMTGGIEVSAETSSFDISKSTENLLFSMGVGEVYAGLLSTMNEEEALASIVVSQTGQSDATIQLLQQLSATEGVNVILSNSEAKIYNLDEVNSESTYVPISKDSLVNKDYVDGLTADYLPLSGGTMSGNIKTSKQFSIANSSNNGHVNLGSIISLTRKNLFDSTKTNTIQVSSSLVEAYVPGDNGVRATLGAGIATLKNYSDNSAFVATKDEDIATKKYVDDSIASIPVTNITVSSTQPTTQKSGDFWYQVTGTV